MSLKSLLIMFIGLAALASLSLFCINHHSPLIEIDLEKRTETSLKFEGLEWSRASMDGQVVTLEGLAPNHALRQKAGEVALAVWGVDAVINHVVIAQHPSAAKPVHPQPEPGKLSAPNLTPYEFKLAYDGKTAILSGFIPNKKARADIREATQQYLAKGSVITRLEIMQGAPEGFIQTITQGLIFHLKDFTQVTAILNDNNLHITGTTSSSKSRDSLQQSMDNAIPDSIVTTYNIEALQSESPAEQKNLTAELCQKQLDALITTQQVTFVPTQAIIEESSYALLNSIASTANKCPDTNIEIAGHTDVNSDSNQNLTLSQRRADAVLSYLVSKNVDIERLTSKGYGETRPIANNTTPADQAKNSRIEFISMEQ
ncbi:MAG: hypothetical protein DSZ28_01955 [Thiothrix sp.]|nr:MAG: hypothetical protein DSZ28_01955 [Thiothrix sp.]